MITEIVDIGNSMQQLTTHDKYQKLHIYSKDIDSEIELLLGDSLIFINQENLKIIVEFLNKQLL